MNKDMILEREVKDNMIISNKQVNKKDSYISKFIKHKFIKFNRRHLHAFILSFSLLIIISLSFLITFNVFIKGENNKTYALSGNLLYSGKCPNNTAGVFYEYYSSGADTLEITGSGTLTGTYQNMIWYDGINGSNVDNKTGSNLGLNASFLSIKGDSDTNKIVFPSDVSKLFNFEGNTHLEGIYLENCDFTNATNINEMFYKCDHLVEFKTKNCTGLDGILSGTTLFNLDNDNVRYVDLSAFDFTNSSITSLGFSNAEVIELPKGVSASDIPLVIDSKYGSRVKYIAVNDKEEAVNNNYNAVTKLIARDTTDTDRDKWITKLKLVPVTYGASSTLYDRYGDSSEVYTYDDCITCYDVSENLDGKVFTYIMKDGTIIFKNEIDTNDDDIVMYDYSDMIPSSYNSVDRNIITINGEGSLLFSSVSAFAYCRNMPWHLYEALNNDYHTKKILAANRVCPNYNSIFSNHCHGLDYFAANFKYLEEIDLKNFYSGRDIERLVDFISNSGTNSPLLTVKMCENSLNPDGKYCYISTFRDMPSNVVIDFSNIDIKLDDDNDLIYFEPREGAKIIVPKSIDSSNCEYYFASFGTLIFKAYGDADNFLGNYTYLPDKDNDNVKYVLVSCDDYRGDKSYNYYSYLFKHLDSLDEDDLYIFDLNYGIKFLIEMITNSYDSNTNSHIYINRNNGTLCDIEDLVINDLDNFYYKMVAEDALGFISGKDFNRFIYEVSKDYLIEEGKYDSYDPMNMEDYMGDLFKDIIDAMFRIKLSLDDTSNLNYFDIANVSTNLPDTKLNKIILDKFVYSFSKDGTIINPVVCVENYWSNISPTIKQEVDKMIVKLNLLNASDPSFDSKKSIFDITSVGNVTNDSYMNLNITITSKGDNINNSIDGQIEIKSTEGNTFDHIYDVDELNSILNEPGKSKTYTYQLNSDLLNDVYRVRTKIEVSTFNLNNDYELTLTFDKTLYNAQVHSYPKTIKEGNYEIITTPYTDDQKYDAMVDSYDDYKALFSNVYHIPETSEHCAYDVYEITDDDYSNILCECLLLSSDVDFDLPVYTLGRRYMFLNEGGALYGDNNVDDLAKNMSSVYNNVAPNDENDKLVAPLDSSLITYDYIVNNFKESYMKIFADNVLYPNIYWLNSGKDLYMQYDYINYLIYGVNLEGTTDPITLGQYVPTPFDDYDDYIGYLALPLKTKVDGSAKTTGNDKELLLTSAGDGLDLVLEAKDFVNNFSNDLKKSNINVKKLSLKNKNVYYSVNKKLVDDDNPITLGTNDITVWYVNNKGKVVNLSYGSDYEIDNTSYKNNNKVGKASFKIVGLDPYVTDSLDAEFNIVGDPDKLKGRDTNYIPPNNDPTPTPDPKPDDKPSITTTTITIGGIVTDPNSTSGYIRGYGDNTIKPNDGITRAEFIKIMAETAPNFSINDQTNLSALDGYDDVNENSWYTPYIGYLLKCKVLTGYDDKTIKPNDKITRAEVCSIISNMYDPKASDSISGNTNNSFNRELDNMWYEDCVMKLVNAGIINGYDDGTFKPNNKITRAETVALVNRTLGIKNDISDYQKQFVINNYNDVKESDWFFSDIARAIFNKK